MTEKYPAIEALKSSTVPEIVLHKHMLTGGPDISAVITTKILVAEIAQLQAENKRYREAVSVAFGYMDAGKDDLAMDTLRQALSEEV